MDTQPQTAPRSFATFRDPVCGVEFPLEKSVGQAAYRGKTYDFCSHECLMKFKADPAPFVDAPEVV